MIFPLWLATALLPMQSEAPISICAEQLCWQGELILKGNVVIEQGFSLTADRISVRFASDGHSIAFIEASDSPKISFPSAPTPAILACNGSLILNASTQSIKTSAPIAYTDDKFSVEAANSVLHYQIDQGSLRPSYLECFDEVRIRSQFENQQETFALADRLIYDIQTHTAILSSKTPKRVLITQPKASLALSAPEVELSFNSQTQEHTIRGIGDVHFSFDLREQTLIETIFSKHL